MNRATIVILILALAYLGFVVITAMLGEPCEIRNPGGLGGPWAVCRD